MCGEHREEAEKRDDLRGRVEHDFRATDRRVRGMFQGLPLKFRQTFDLISVHSQRYAFFHLIKYSLH